MKISLAWLSEHVDLAGLSTEAMSDLLTFAGVEVEEIEERKIHEKIVVAEVLEREPHPDAEKLSVCKVKHGEDTSQIVCGAKNFKVGDKIPLALPGTVLPGGMKIKKGKLRGVESQGMMCSGDEIGIPTSVDGLLILDPELEVGKPLQSVYPMDTQLTIEVTPNRPDWLSHLGLAREVAAVTDRKLESHPIVASATKTRPAAGDALKIDADSACPFYSARVIKGVTVAESPEWLKSRLEAIGLRPINNIVDITNFVLMEMGQPLHAFDMAKLDGGIHVRLAKPGEKLTALDEEVYELCAADTVIADAKQPLAIAGVMGGAGSGVTGTTTDVLLEAAYFHPPSIRRTSHRLTLSSDSSYRFERGVDPQQVLGASDLATKLILELAGGTAEEVIQVAGEIPVLNGEVELDHAHCTRLLGHKIEDERIMQILASLGLEKTQFNAGISSWKIPSYRLDLSRGVDLIEEVARIFGLDNLPAAGTLCPSLPRDEDRTYDLSMSLKRRLVSLGFCETPTLSMVSEAQISGAATGSERAAVTIKNPIGVDYGTLRTSLLSGLAINELSSGLLNVASRNANLGAPTARLFEVGQVYTSKGEGTHVALLMAGNANEIGWMTPRPRALTIHDLRGVIESLIPGVPIRLDVVEDANVALAADMFIRLSGNDTCLGRIAQCTPGEARKIGYGSVMIAELRMRTLKKLLAKPAKFVAISPYPAITRDVAMEVDATVSSQDVSQFFSSYKEDLLENVALFDVFADPTGEKLDASKKSLAYSLTYRAKNKTLESKVVDKAHAKVLTALQQKLGVTIR